MIFLLQKFKSLIYKLRLHKAWVTKNVMLKFLEKSTPYPRYFFYFPTVNMFVLVQHMHIPTKAIHIIYLKIIYNHTNFFLY